MIFGLALLALLVSVVVFVNKAAEDEPERIPERPVLTWY